MLVERPLFGLGGFADAVFDGSVLDRDEAPRLLVGAAGRGACGPQALFDDRPWHLRRRVIADGAATSRSSANAFAAATRSSSVIDGIGGRAMVGALCIIGSGRAQCACARTIAG